MCKLFGLGHKEGYYKNPLRFTYYTARYQKFVTVERGFPSDGATGAIDVCSKAWLTHDKLCKTGRFNDGSLCTNWQASMIIGDILSDDCNRRVRRWTWPIATLLFGGGQCRKNGMFTL